ncbi:hypothetical protein MNEG_0751 [Monoraphidium neglectum]|uniref:EF-hand domain-containing protein n=1 Tax=Monoraphidium neglectum TaxID=145388 RepID=A0A0D2MXJ9_9CHLO|nr:hypothetical protein MNEG_0751 [Monoraphidium neglectum]KIZ07200.1 hypothetical protein MNEG_0751 [Monoraphidium neglectum]|eukprot:XP_013906219.1 hypothetical protein MNEG_0751 [Monoraphidium neglectum]
MAPDVVSSIPTVPVTQDRRAPLGLEKDINEPGVPRANKAVSRERPEGSPASLAREDYSHVAFFDRDNDGVLWPMDTYVGFRRIGFNRIISFLAVPFIHGSFSYPTGLSWIPDPFFRIHIKNMHKAKHGSDSEVYDTEGRYVPEKYEELFSKYDRDNKGGLNWNDIQEMIKGNMNIVDPVGWTAERLEWWALWLLCADDDGVISREKIRAQYDGSLWYILAEENERRQAARKEANRSKWE